MKLLRNASNKGYYQINKIKMVVLIINTHSALNSGDSGILLAQIDFLQNHFKQVDISLVSRTPAIDQKFYKNRITDIFPPKVISLFLSHKYYLFYHP